ncbi:MAG: hypothetical protein Q4C85_06115 [Actinomyces sp.]|uniref:hypothetical protein n=1 Tax=Actinomyces sp. TaxID=29317 RepID=UPI0026DDA530|nr:hypothetical protein [Actinomyces sp.]MDO4243326.1 hypothetical protein [Actinomyces sp.]
MRARAWIRAAGQCPGLDPAACTLWADRLRLLGGGGLEDLLAGFAVDGHRELTAASTATYLAALEVLWASRPQESATRLVAGLFPASGDARDLEAVQEWLNEHPDAPAALRRLILKARDDLRRVLQVRAAARRAHALRG